MSNATVRTRHARPGVVARAVRPDNTDRMETRIDGDAVRTELSRDGADGLRATLDDYTVNVTVADRIVQIADRHTTQP